MESEYTEKLINQNIENALRRGIKPEHMHDFISTLHEFQGLPSIKQTSLLKRINQIKKGLNDGM